MRTLNKQKIKLVSGRTRSLTGKVSAEHARNSGAENNESASFNGAEITALVEKCLTTIVKSTGAVAGAVRILSPSGLELQMLGSIGLPSDVVNCESVVDSGCGACGQAARGRAAGGNGSGVPNVDVCVQRCGAAYFGAACNHVFAAPLVRPDKAAEPVGVLTLFFATATEIQADGMQAISAYAELVSAALDSAIRNAESRRINLLAERQSIANEIHDALAQTLYYAKMRSSLLLEALRTENDLLAFKCARDIDDALDSGQKAVRELVTYFRCQMDPQGLQFTLQKLVHDFCARTDIPLKYVNRVADMDLPLEYELQVFLIVREALVNVGTHSGATAAYLTVAKNDGRYTFTVEDNGAGCVNAPVDGHYGMTIMRERAARIGGEVQVESFEGLGTRVRLNFAIPTA